MDYGRQLAQELGGHVLLGPLLLWPLLGFALASLGGRLHGWRALRAVPGADQHWAEVARWAYTCRYSAVFTGMVTVMLVPGFAWAATKPLGLLGGFITSLTTLSTCVGARVAFVRRFPQLVPETSLREHLDDLLLVPGLLFAWAVWPLLLLGGAVSACSGAAPRTGLATR